MGRSRGGSTGAVAAGGDDGHKKRGLAWLWPLLALLALALLLFLLLRGGDDDDKDKASTKTQTTQSASPTPTQTPAAAEATGGASAGSLTAGGKDLLPVSGAGDIGETAGEEATGKDVVVQELVPGQGFWVGSSQEDRVYVELGGDVGQDEQPGGDKDLKVGDKVNLTGEMRPAPEDPMKVLNLDEISAQQVADQGAYVNADEVNPVK